MQLNVKVRPPTGPPLRSSHAAAHAKCVVHRMHMHKLFRPSPDKQGPKYVSIRFIFRGPEAPGRSLDYRPGPVRVLDPNNISNPMDTLPQRQGIPVGVPYSKYWVAIHTGLQ